MRGSLVESAPERGRVLNAVALQNAVLCAECDVVSDSPHDRCLVCGSRSLLNIARMFEGNLPKERASLIDDEAAEIGTGAPGGGSLIGVATDSPLSGAKAVIYTSPTTLGSFPASVITAPP